MSSKEKVKYLDLDPAHIQIVPICLAHLQHGFTKQEGLHKCKDIWTTFPILHLVQG